MMETRRGHRERTGDWGIDKNMMEQIITLEEEGMAINETRKTMDELWEGRGDITREINREPPAHRMTDSEARANPDRLYKQVCKGMESTTISSLIEKGEVINSNTGIEKVLTNYLEALGGKEEERTDDTENEEDGRLSGMMRPTSQSEIMETIRSLDPQSSAVGMPTKLLKIAAMGSWTEMKPYTKKQKIEARHRAELQGGVWMMDEGKEETKQADRAMKIIQKIIDFSLEAGTIPTEDKKGIVTGLPKKGGQVNSTKTI